MSKVPKSAMKEIRRKCPLCGKIFKSKEYLVNHIDKSHHDEIPQDWSPARYENYLRTGKTHGNCVVCKQPTTWNESTWKYNRLCNNKKCIEEISKSADKNMIGKYGKKHLLNDAEQQRKMIYNKKTSGMYYWTTDTKKEYVKYYASSVELKFLEMLDVFLNLEPEDVLSPSPNNYVYKYDGKDHMYIPDVYIPSINLEIELKEPKNNQNMHPKIQAVDKVKEQLKDELMTSIDLVNYIKINGTDYREFFELFAYLKNKDTIYPSTEVDQSIIESVGNGVLDDEELAELFSEIMQEPVVETKMNMIASKLTTGKEKLNLLNNLFIDPKLNYNEQIKLYEDHVNKCDNIADYNEIYMSLTTFRAYLKSIINNNDNHDDDDMKYEAGRALSKVDYLLDKLNKKYLKMKKSCVSESNVYEYVGDKSEEVSKAYPKVVNETSMKSIVYKDFKSKGRKSLSSFKRVNVTSEFLKKHKNETPMLKHLRPNDDVNTTVAWMDQNNIVGYVSVSKPNNSSDKYYGYNWITALEVAPNYRGYGLGKELLEYGVKNLKGNALGVAYDNDVAIAMYKKAGFKIGKEKNGNHILMYLTPPNYQRPQSATESNDYEYVNESTITGYKNGERYKPVYIILTYKDRWLSKAIRKVTNSDYSHATLALDTDLAEMFSFDRRGMVTDGITSNAFKSKDSGYCLYTYLATENEYNIMQQVIHEFEQKKDELRYSIIGLANYLFGRESTSTDEWFCSEFVSYVLKQANPQLLKKHYSLYSPIDLVKTRKFIKTDFGNINNYNPSRVDAKVRKILTKKGFENVSFEK